MGCVIETSSPLVVPRIKAKLFLRGYEPVEINFVKKYLHPDRDVIDLGSSLGVVASHIGRKLHAGQHVICVEANPQLLDIIRANVSRNAPHVQLEIVSGAVDYPPDQRPLVELALGFDNLVAHIVDEVPVVDGVESWEAPAAGSAGYPQRPLRVNPASAIHRAWWRSPATLAPGGLLGAFMLVPVISLSKIIKRHNIGEYTLVSDIEGSEAGLLEMDGAGLAHCCQMIIELHHTVRRDRIILAEELATELQAKYNFKQIDRHGSVYVFEK